VSRYSLPLALFHHRIVPCSSDHLAAVVSAPPPPAAAASVGGCHFHSQAALPSLYVALSPARWEPSLVADPRQGVEEEQAALAVDVARAAAAAVAVVVLRCVSSEPPQLESQLIAVRSPAV